MTESSVSSPFMKQLRAALPDGGIVLKHHDASMIGMGDCEIIWQKKVGWLEFKLVIPGAREGWFVPAKIAHASPTQHEFMCRMGLEAHFSWYVFWVKKSKKIVVWDPLRNLTLFECQTTPELVDWVVGCLRAL